AGGAAISRSFSFTAGGACGTNISPTFQLQDGAQNLGRVSFSLPIGGLSSLFSQNFDGINAPGLPAGWTTSITGGQSSWTTTASTSDTAPNSAFSPDPGSVGLNELNTPTINLPSTSAQLSFRHS